MVSVQFSILAALLGLCYIPARVQSTFPDCAKKVVCNMTSCVSECCKRSPTNVMMMELCVKWNLTMGMMRECMQSPGAKANPFGQLGSSNATQFMPNQACQTAMAGMMTQCMQSPGAKANPFEQLGSSNATQFMPNQACQTAMAGMMTQCMQSPGVKGNPFGQFMPNQACQTAMANMPRGVGDCSSWSGAVAGCVKSIPFIQNICGSTTFGGTGSA